MQNQDVSKHSPKVGLEIFKASAGSGKTHRLTAEYLKLLFSSPNAYKHILAVTFTNKATDEMKMRIIEELHNLATEKKSDFISLLKNEYQLDENQIKQKAAEHLLLLLHDYASFSVSTIDHFFQQTMRAFTREIGLNGNYKIELDTDKILNEAIDNMLFGLEESKNKLLLEWLIQFSEEKIENGETWNIKNDILTLSRELFKEEYKIYSDIFLSDITDKDLMKEHKKMLQKIIKSFQDNLSQIAEKAANIIYNNELKIEDFKYGITSPFKQFLKWANGNTDEPSIRFRNLADNIQEWYTSKTEIDKKDQIITCFAELNNLVKSIIFLFDNAEIYNSAIEINRYFFVLGILGDVDANIRKYTADNNTMLISDTTNLLNKIIDDNDSPFIYEKIGTRIDHYMIDEFQDTSSMQWKNFKPLLKDSLAYGNKNYIVGDVKQSIYRWRNSDWKLLNEQVDLDFQEEGTYHEILDQNWRSGYNIINFNNILFSNASQLLQNEYNSQITNYSEYESINRIEKAYDKLEQSIPESRKDIAGHVKIEFIASDKKEWNNEALEKLPIEIEQLQNKGYALKDIAILVRTKKEGITIVDYLLRYKEEHSNSKYCYDIISDEALYIENSNSIKLIIALLKYLRTPSDLSLKYLAIYEYFKYHNHLNAEDTLEELFSKKADLPSSVNQKLQEISKLPLYEMVEEIFRYFNDIINPNDQIYIQAFLDLILDFSIHNTPDLNTFLIWWDKSGSTKTINTPSEQDAIRILTIHKSKGLGFKAVIIPFCNWEIDHKLPVILWCRPKTEPFSAMKLVPVKYSSKLKNTIFKDEYFDEKLHVFIDNINILYVAFTRAKEELIIFTLKPQKNEIKNISSLLQQSILSSHNKSDIDLRSYYKENTNLLEIGEEYLPQQTNNNLKQDKQISIKHVPTISFNNRVKIQLKNQSFLSKDGKRNFGTLLHEILSHINTSNELEPIINKYHISGDLTKQQANEVCEVLKKYMNDTQVKEWYSGKFKILNETDILGPKGNICRPDRVMINDNGEIIIIDYKFGQKELKKYIKQMELYKKQILKMGYKSVKGFLCYIYLNKVIEIWS